MVRYPLPGDTRAAFESHRAPRQNPGLLFDRYVPVIEEDGQKQETLRQVRDCLQDEVLIKASLERWREVAAYVGAEPFGARTAWRLITGLGRKGALEVGFHFHPLYGFPVLPASGLKGLARSWALLGEGKDELDADFIAVFGRARQKGEPESAGRVGGAVFLDAMPEGQVKLALDVMNPHYPEYYRPGNRREPALWQSPVPVFFLTVPEKTLFRFAVGWQGVPNATAHDLAVKWLQAGLRELGAGAKTNAGYGYWELVT